jgi:hypothetical protein
MANGPISSKQVSIEVVRRTLISTPGSAAAQHKYSRVFHTRAMVKSAGTSEWGQVDIVGKKPTHTFTIRWTSLAFDVRDRVRDARGQLFQILSIENVDLRNRELRIMTSNQGDESIAAAR